MADVTFFFDPVCPWTWRASRWLTTVAEARGLAVEWQPCSLLVVNDGPDEEHGAELEASHRALRLVAYLRQEGRHDEIAGLYTAIGTLAHEEGYAFDDELIAQGVRTAGLAADGPALDEEALDGKVRLSTETALELAGPGVGSPVMTIPGAARGLHGPVLGAVPGKADALALWDAVDVMFRLPEFFEIKRGRT
jgi:hypothetical protein